MSGRHGRVRITLLVQVSLKETKSQFGSTYTRRAEQACRKLEQRLEIFVASDFFSLARFIPSDVGS